MGKEYLLVAHKIEECSLRFNDGYMDGLSAKSSENELAHKGTCCGCKEQGHKWVDFSARYLDNKDSSNDDSDDKDSSNDDSEGKD
eukprot:15364799-Ditylum_brightwellii.AAC.1